MLNIISFLIHDSACMIALSVMCLHALLISMKKFIFLLHMQVCMDFSNMYNDGVVYN